MTLLQLIKAIEVHYKREYTAEQRGLLAQWAQSWDGMDLAKVFERVKERLPVETGWIPGRPLLTEVCRTIASEDKAQREANKASMNRSTLKAPEDVPSDEERAAAAEEMGAILKRLMVPGHR